LKELKHPIVERVRLAIVNHDEVVHEKRTQKLVDAVILQE